MTVATTLNKKQYQGNGLTKEFPLPFQVTAKEHIFALLKKGTAIHEIKNNFAVDLERKVFIYPVQGEAIQTGENLIIYRKIPLTQIVDLENAGAFHPEVLEHDGFDRIVMQIQQLDEEISRALKIDITDTRDVTNLLEELFKARAEAVLSAQKALEQAEIATDKAEKSQNWALFAEEKVEELTDLEVACFISNDGQGQVLYDKDKHKLEIVLPFDNSGSSQQKVVLTDSIDLARSDIGASAKAVQSLQTKINQEMTAALAGKLDKTALSNAIDSESETAAASSAAVNDLRLKVPNLAMPSEKYIEYPLSSFDFTDAETGNGAGSYRKEFVAPANGYMQLAVTYSNSETFAGIAVYSDAAHSKLLYSDGCRNRAIQCFLPVFKGAYCNMAFSSPEKFNYARFIYAEGEL